MHCKPSDEFPPIIMQGQTDEQARHTMPHAVAQTHSELMENMNSMLRKEPLPQLPPDEPEPVDTINHVPFQPVGSCQGRYTAIKPMLPRKIDDEEVMDTNPDRNGNVSGKLSSNPKDIAAAGKCPLHLIPPVAESEIAWVLSDGAAKYGAWNWRREKISLSSYLGAMRRHINRILDGEDSDGESGLLHLAHVAATCCIVMDAMEHDCVIDDRPGT